MTDYMGEPGPEPDDINDEALASEMGVLLEYYLTCFCTEHGIDSAAAYRANPSEFATWLETMLSGKRYAAGATDGRPDCATDRAWDTLHRIADKDLEMFVNGNWIAIALGNRPTPQNVVVGVTATIIVRFADGTIALDQGYIDREMSTGPLEDAALAIGLQTMLRSLHTSVVARGVDQLYDEGSTVDLGRGLETDVRDVIIGLLLQQARAAKPVFRAPLTNYARMFEQIFCPNIPRSKLLQARSVVDEDAPPNLIPPGGAVGGWS
jgi:hypothetical protein